MRKTINCKSFYLPQRVLVLAMKAPFSVMLTCICPSVWVPNDRPMAGMASVTSTRPAGKLYLVILLYVSRLISYMYIKQLLWDLEGWSAMPSWEQLGECGCHLRWCHRRWVCSLTPCHWPAAPPDAGLCGGTGNTRQLLAIYRLYKLPVTSSIYKNNYNSQEA